MLGVLLLAVTAPEPSATPLKTISHIHASPFCTALRQNIGHAVLGLMKNDAVIVDGKSLFLQMAQDKVSRASPSMVIDMDMERMSRVVNEMVVNLAQIDAELNDLKSIPNDPKTEDDRRLVQMRDNLRAVADRQRDALNVFSGTYYSYKSNELNGRGNPIAGAVASEKSTHAGGASPNEDDTPPIVLPPIKSSAKSIATPSPSPSSTQKPGAVVDMGLVGYTPYAGLFNSLTTVQLHEQPLEAQAAQTILQYTGECK